MSATVTKIKNNRKKLFTLTIFLFFFYFSYTQISPIDLI